MIIISKNNKFSNKSLLMIVLSFFFSTVSAYADNSALEPSSIWYPKVAPVFQNSCSQCHVAKENGKKGMAARKLDLTDYLSSKQITLSETELAKIENVLQKGIMPPKSYLWRHPESKISESDKAAILEWIKAERSQ